MHAELNAPAKEERLDALRGITASPGGRKSPARGGYVNNHIHTTYSFSPYSPSLAVYTAAEQGLQVAGLVDHDTIAGAGEFTEAGAILNLPVTLGVECRVSFAGTRLEGRFINHPDQASVAYVALHGIPRSRIRETRDYFSPLIALRHERNRAMAANLNRFMNAFGYNIDYDADVLPLSEHADGGTVTERHLLFAAARCLAEKLGRGNALVRFLRERLKVEPPAKISSYLGDPSNPHYLYDLLGALKSRLTPVFYVPAARECPAVEEAASFSRRIGAVFAYAYLGDVGDSVTGDKKAQRFEDAYLDLLFEELVRIGFQAVTYMPSRNTPGQLRRVRPSRNTPGQLRRVRALCRRHRLLEISGEDINSPRQSFICPALAEPGFSHLKETAWALIGHEKEALRDPGSGLFGSAALERWPELDDRVRRFAALGRSAGEGP